jgi:hypothetical protein
MSENENGATGKKKKIGLFNYILGGRFLTSDIITKNSLLIGLIILYSFIYVSNRYEYEQELIKINRLTKVRDELKNNLLTLECDFTYNNRPTELVKLLEQKNSKLKINTTPPVRLSK